MLDVAVKFLATELNAFLAARAAIDSSGMGGAVVSRIGSATSGGISRRNRSWSA
jgi:hypothetical protein